MSGRLPQVACRHCGSLHQRVSIASGAQANCRLCGYVLYRESGIALGGWIALVLATLVVFAIANLFPLGSLDLAGKQVQATMLQALRMTWLQGHVGLSLMTGLFACLFPLLQLLFLLWAMLCLVQRKLPSDFHIGLRILHHLAPWSMAPVLLLAIVVAVVKLAGMAHFEAGPAIPAFAALSVLMTMLSRVTAQSLWYRAEDAGLVPVSGNTCLDSATHVACLDCGYVQQRVLTRCGRCGASVHHRKPYAISRAAALALAAAILYIPANLLPVMWLRTPTGLTSHTIMGGVIELWQFGSWDLAVIVFIASVVVPITKLLALAVLMVKRHWIDEATQRQRTRLYELVEFIGQWSMLDVFVVVLLSAMADFPGLSQVQAGAGALSFGLVVILTMLAALSYDPRIGWDGRFAIKANDSIASHTVDGRIGICRTMSPTIHDAKPHD